MRLPRCHTSIFAFLAATFFATVSLAAYYNILGFWHSGKATTLVFTTTAQTLTAGACSGIITVQEQNNGGAPIKASSPVTIILNNTAVAYYSDSACTQQVFYVTIGTSTNSQSFYFIAQSTSTITASATNLTSASQTETMNTSSVITGFGYNQQSYAGIALYGSGPSLAVYNNQLYMASLQWYGGGQIYVDVFNGNNSAPTWTDTTGGAGVIYNNTDGAYNPVLISYNGNLYCFFKEDTGWNEVYQVRVKVFNGTSWSAADPGSLNQDTSSASGNPIPAIYNGNLYVTWGENTGLIHVAEYGGGTTWTLVDDNGSGGTTATGYMNYDSGNWTSSPTIYSNNGYLFAAWNEVAQLRVKYFNGTGWSAGDSGSGIQYNSTYYGGVASMAVLNNKLYISYLDYPNGDSGVLHALVYNGGTTWSFIDGSSPNFLNFQAYSGSQVQTLYTFQGRLYVGWQETDTAPNISYANTQNRLSVYNGNDSSPAWTPVVGVSYDGMGYVPWGGDSNGGNTTFAVLGNKLYGSWDDVQTIDTGFFTQGTTPTKLWFPDISDNIVENDGDFEYSGCNADEVRLADSNGFPAFATSSTTVTLSGAGLAFYSDNFCTQPLTSNQVTIAAGDSGAHFYVLVTGSGDSYTATGAATGYTSATQGIYDTQAAIWTGGNAGSGCTGVWTDQSCWTINGGINNGYPNYWNSHAYFTSQCVTAPCSASINADIEVSALFLQNGYTSTVTLAAGQTLTVDDVFHVAGGTFSAGSGTISSGAAWYLSGGTFNGGSSTINLTGGFTLDGGTFSGGTSAITLNNDAPFEAISGSFTNTSGNFTFTGVGGTQLVNFGSGLTYTAAGTLLFTGTNSYFLGMSSGVTLGNVKFEETNGACIAIAGTVTIGGTLTVDNDSTSGFCATQTGATVVAKGNVTGTAGAADYTWDGGGFTTLEIAGSGNQTITGTAVELPGIIDIASTGGTVTLAGNIGNTAGWTYTSGTVSAGTSTVTFGNLNGIEVMDNISSGSMSFNNVKFEGGQAGEYSDIFITGTMNIGGNLTIDNLSSNGATIDGGTIALTGNLTLTDNAGGSASITFTGGNTPQTYTATGGTLPSGTITVNKTLATTLKLSSALTANTSGQAFNITQGTVDLNSQNLVGGFALTVGASGTLLLKGVETISDSSNTFNAGSLVEYYGTGNYSASDLALGDTYYNVMFDGTGGKWKYLSPLTVNGSITLTAGTLTDGGGATVAGNWTNNGGTFTPGTNTVTFTGNASHTIGGTGNSSFYNLAMTTTAAESLTVTHGLTLTATHGLNLAGASGKVRTFTSDNTTAFSLAPPAATTLNGCLAIDYSNSSAVIHCGNTTCAACTHAGADTDWDFP